ncbi:MAG: hypothetical protein LBC71_02715, partial [Oscillospiraceae bacterium]|nr:hypothetical protein [Oscillospiraceae bacterium]
MFSQENVYFRESDAYDVLEKLNAANISVSVIADIDGKYSQGYVFDLITGTGGVLIEISDIVEAAEIQPAALSFNTSFPQLQAMSSMVTQITAVSQMAARLSSNDNFVGPPQHIALPTLRHIFGDNLSFPVIMATGYQQIRLERPLIIGSSTDTDGDGIPDYQEVNLTLLNIEGRRVSLPKIIDLMELPDKPYVDANMMRLGQLPNFVHAIHQRVLPIRSNPADADTDGDGIPDNLDKFPLRDRK